MLLHSSLTAIGSDWRKELQSLYDRASFSLSCCSCWCSVCRWSELRPYPGCRSPCCQPCSPCGWELAELVTLAVLGTAWERPGVAAGPLALAAALRGGAPLVDGPVASGVEERTELWNIRWSDRYRDSFALLANPELTMCLTLTRWCCFVTFTWAACS